MPRKKEVKSAPPIEEIGDDGGVPHPCNDPRRIANGASEALSSSRIDELMHETMMVLNEVCTSLYGLRSQWNDEDPAVKQFYKFEALIGGYYGTA